MAEDVKIELGFEISENSKVKVINETKATGEKASASFENSFNKLNFSQTTNNLKNSISSLDFSGIGSSIRSEFASIGTTLASGYLAIKFFRDSIEEAGGKESEILKLNQALAQTGNYSKSASDFILKMADDLEQTTKYDGGDITNLASKFLELSRINLDNLPKATQAILDFATAKGEDPSTTAVKLAQSINTTRNAFKAYTGEIDKALPPSERANIIIGKLLERFGGSSATLVDSYNGRIDQLSKSYKNLAENAGKAFTESASAEASQIALKKTLDKLGKSDFSFLFDLTELFHGFTASVAGSLGFIFKSIATLILKIDLFLSETVGRVAEAIQENVNAVKSGLSKLGEFFNISLLKNLEKSDFSDRFSKNFTSRLRDGLKRELSEDNFLTSYGKSFFEEKYRLEAQGKKKKKEEVNQKPVDEIDLTKEPKEIKEKTPKIFKFDDTYKEYFANVGKEFNLLTEKFKGSGFRLFQDDDADLIRLQNEFSAKNALLQENNLYQLEQAKGLLESKAIAQEEYDARIASLEKASEDRRTALETERKTREDAIAQRGLQRANLVNSAITQGISQTISAIVQSVFQGNFSLSQLGKQLSGFLGDLMVNTGSQLIAVGVGIEALKKLSGGTAIAVGIALVALGSIAKRFSSGGGSSTPSFGSSSPNSSGFGGGVPSDVNAPTTQTTSPQDLTPKEKTYVNVNIQGDVLDSEQSGLRIVKILDEAFGKNGLTLRAGVAT